MRTESVTFWENANKMKCPEEIQCKNFFHIGPFWETFYDLCIKYYSFKGKQAVKTNLVKYLLLLT